MDHALHDHAVHVLPWVVVAVFCVAGTLLHAFVATTWSRAGTVALILAGTAVMTHSVWHTNRSRTATARWHGVTTTGFGGAWLALCTITGFVTLDGPPEHWYLQAHGFTIATYCAIGATSAAIWNTRINARHRAAELAELMAQHTPEITNMERAGHKGAVLTLRQVDQWRLEGTLVLAGGDSLAAFQKDLPSVETAHGFPPNSMTVTQRRDVTNACVCDVTVMLGNPIEDPQPWPGLLVGVK